MRKGPTRRREKDSGGKRGNEYYIICIEGYNGTYYFACQLKISTYFLTLYDARGSENSIIKT